MICMTESAAKSLVLGKIAGNRVFPTDLLVLLDQVLSYADIQEAVSELLYEGRIILTPERQLVKRTVDDVRAQC